MMKRFFLLGLVALLLPALAVSAEPAEQALGGVYNKVVGSDEGDYAREGTVTVIFDGQGKAWFKLNLGRKDGATAILSAEDWIPAGNRQFDYNYKDGSVDYTMHVRLTSDDKLVISEDFNAGGSPYGMGMTAGGDYELDQSYVAAENGYLFHYVREASELELCAGGFYSGQVFVPEAVYCKGGVTMEVAGVAAKAFWGNEAVKDVNWDRGSQYVGPAAFYRSGMHYYWKGGYSLPGYVYPS